MKRDGSVLGLLAGFTLTLLPTAAWIYFLVRTVSLERWLLMTLGVVLPPIGIVAGGLAWFGVILQTPPAAAEDDLQKRTTMGYTTLIGAEAMIDRCRWDEFSQEDLKGIAKTNAHTKKVLGETYHLSEEYITALENGSKRVAGGMRCEDEKLRAGMANLIAQLRPNFGRF